MIEDVNYPAGGYPTVITLASISPAAANALREIGTRRIWRDRDVVLYHGETASAALMVLRGRLKVTVATPQGEHIVRWLEQGETTALASALTGAPLAANLVAEGRTEVLHIDRDRLARRLRDDPETCFALLKLMCLNVERLLGAIGNQAARRLENRVWTAIKRLARFSGKPVPEGLLLEISQGDIARAVSASRQRVNVELARLEERGWIRLGYRKIVLLDKPETAPA